jgi:hypothetical protein
LAASTFRRQKLQERFELKQLQERFEKTGSLIG